MTWDDLNQSGPCGHPFASEAYLALVEKTFRGRVESIEIEGDGGGVTAGARLLVRRSPFVLRSVVPAYTPYSAIQLERMPSEAETHDRSSTLERLLEAIENRYAAIDVNLPPQIVDVRTFSWRRWAVRPLYTYRVALDEETLAMKTWSESAARIAQRESEDYEIAATEPGVVAEKSSESYRRSDRRPPLFRDRLEKFLEEARTSAGASLIGARNRESGKVESAVAIMRHGTAAYYWIAGGSRGSSMTVLLGRLFRDLSDDGIETFDFVGANTDSIAEFKRKFGGRLTTYFRAAWRHGPAVAAEDAVRSLR